jgi:glycosyltransferase involved in cell wall biosynthesis
MKALPSTVRFATDLSPVKTQNPCAQRDQRYFKEQLEPLIDGDQVQLTGEVNDKTKEAFLAGAAALLFPSTGPSPSAWS